MRKLFLVAGLAAAALIPSIASAQQSCQAQRDNQVAGTVVGAGLGALIGSAVAGRGDHTTGAVVGGIGGAVVGNQLSKPYANCAHAYGYYDRDSQWHANDVASSEAQGYYDRDGAWVAGAPNGYYDTSGSWRPAHTAPSSSGYTDRYGRWVPASADGYYNDKNDWVTTASGHYDGEGRWIRGQASGAYDAHGNWTPGATNGHRDATGRWIANAQPGYYDGEHRWRSGAAWGYYDTDGRWIATSSGAYDSQAAYPNVQGRAGVQRDVDSREDRLEQRIRSSTDNGTLPSADARKDMRSLSSIRRQERELRGSDGRLSQQDEATLQARLDRLGDELRQSTGQDRRS